MATWRKVLVVGLAVLVGAVPVLAKVEAGMQVAVPECQQTQVPLPSGDEMSDDELLQAEGELAPLLVLLGYVLAGAAIGAGIGAGVGAIKAQWFDEEHGIDDDDLREDIAHGAAAGAWCGANEVMKRLFII